MSVPVRYSAAKCDSSAGGSNIVCMSDNLLQNNATDVNMVDTEMREQWIRMPSSSSGGDGGCRLGIPGAAAGGYQEEHQEKNQQQQSQSSLQLLQRNNSQTAEFDALSNDVLYGKLKEFYTLESKYHTCLILPQESPREITAGARDGSAYVLRCLKVWYELPSDVLFAAINLVDRFLNRMTVKPKHMACISVASFHLAIKQLQLEPINLDDLATISQVGCTARDLERMAGVIENKLGVQFGHPPVTALNFVRLIYILFRRLAMEMGGLFFDQFEKVIKLEELEMAIEILLCDVRTTLAVPSTLALALVCNHLEMHLGKSYSIQSPEISRLAEYGVYLQEFIGMPHEVFICAKSLVSQILHSYNNQHKTPYKQRLVWRLSTRTMRALRPTNKLTSYLPTIEEHRSSMMDDNPFRLRTESSSSEEEEDWPTSPIIPIFEQC
ncbi:unnamed protein product [Hermetia illucens]|uniref:Cyclin-like domain-containing protein n=2 Tax=Hermetia illucens TaxID=343691 RepID=A0A7R8V4P6_HERIL|nr:cyclin G-like isoform X3 [Hermetia illucens]XP_037924265.1 cyclin G-like isoform X3 [Hermetia illucens]CAD7092768.1 unnamed protein product [Hermetia illucens]